MKAKKLFFFTLISLLIFILFSIPSYATDYYVNASGGNDSKNGRSTTTAWRTIAKVNSSRFSPGDTIKFKCDEVWREQLNISWNGTHDNRITFTNYGTGNNPLIRMSDQVSSWAYANEKYSVWKCTLPNNRVRGILNADGTHREHCYLSKPAYADWEDNYFVGWYVSNGVGYLKSTSSPGAREVGSRQYGIYITASYVTIDGIDVYGPGGSTTSASKTYTTNVHMARGDYIEIKNGTFKHGAHKVIVPKGQHWLIENCQIYDFNNGIYGAGQDGVVRGCYLDRVAFVEGDKGDAHIIAFNAGKRITVEKCYIDDALAPKNAVTWSDEANDGVFRWNYVTNCGGSAVVFGQPGGTPPTMGGFECYGNVIDGWGSNPRPDKLNSSVCGLKFNTGTEIQPPRPGVEINWGTLKIYNNLFINGDSITNVSDRKGALLTPFDYGGKRGDRYKLKNLYIKNNIFYNNVGPELYVLSNNVKSGGVVEISNNWFYKTTSSDDAVWFDGRMYDANHVKCEDVRCFNSESGVSANESGNPRLLNPNGSINDFALQSTSPCIDAGTPVGLSIDFNGDPVPVGNGVDIGPFEYQGPGGGISAPSSLTMVN